MAAKKKAAKKVDGRPKGIKSGSSTDAQLRLDRILAAMNAQGMSETALYLACVRCGFSGTKPGLSSVLKGRVPNPGVRVAGAIRQALGLKWEDIVLDGDPDRAR